MQEIGDNIAPPFTAPIQWIERDASGRITAIRYDYPKQDDHLIRDLEPLFEEAGVDLVFYGHSHLWNRFVGETAIHFFESSNVGNSYGAYLGNDRRGSVPPELADVYDASGEPYGLTPITPNIRPFTGADGTPQPYVASNDITVFSILDTGSDTVGSYYFDTR